MVNLFCLFGVSAKHFSDDVSETVSDNVAGGKRGRKRRWLETCLPEIVLSLTEERCQRKAALGEDSPANGTQGSETLISTSA